MVLEELEDNGYGFPGRLNEKQKEALEDFETQLKNWREQNTAEAAAEDYVISGLQAAGHNEQTIHLKFLRARGFDVKVALDLYTASLTWAVQFQDIGVRNIKRETIQTEIDTGKCMAWGKDNDGRPCIYVRAALHKKSKSDPKELERYMAWFFDKSKQIVKAPVETATVVIDLSNVGMDSLDVSAARAMADMLGQRYPESLGYGLLVDSPWVFSAFWKVIKPFIDPRTIKKIRLISRKELSQFIPPTEIPSEFGGKAIYEREQDPILALAANIENSPQK